MKTVLAYLGGFWLACGALLAFGWTLARVMYRAEKDARRSERAFGEVAGAPPIHGYVGPGARRVRPTSGKNAAEVLRRLADEGAEILARERSEG